MARGKSPALKLATLVWNGTNEVTSHSWPRLNTAMSSAVHLAISSGMRFNLKDFNYMSKHLRIHYWAGEDPTERFYAEACTTPNMSACHSLEHWMKREPFILKPSESLKYSGRIYIGADFEWKGELVFCTSFAEDNSRLTACSYHEPPEDNLYLKKILHRHSITHEDIKDHRKELKEFQRKGA